MSEYDIYQGFVPKKSIIRLRYIFSVDVCSKTSISKQVSDDNSM
jgi:hypothetical protein